MPVVRIGVDDANVAAGPDGRGLLLGLRSRVDGDVMTADMAIRTGLPGELRSNAYILPPDLSYDEWLGVVALAEHIEAASPWWLGDAIVYGERRFPDRHTQALPVATEDPAGVRQSRMKATAWVSAKFPPVTRVTGLSWSHHRVVAELDIEEARPLLMAAINPMIEGKPPLSTRELINLRDRKREHLRGRAVDANGEPIETTDLPWCATEADLTDEARASMTAYAPQGRFRTAWVAGYLRALQWADVESAFLPERWQP